MVDLLIIILTGVADATRGEAVVDRFGFEAAWRGSAYVWRDTPKDTLKDTPPGV